MYNGNMENWSCDLGYEKTKAERSNSFSPCFQMLLCRRQLEEKKKERKENTPFKPWLNVKQAQRESIT